MLRYCEKVGRSAPPPARPRAGAAAGSATGAVLALLLVAGPDHAAAQDTYTSPDQEAMQAMLDEWAETDSGAGDGSTAAEPDSGAPTRSTEAAHPADDDDGRATIAADSPCGLAVTVTSGDTLSKIARRCETSVEALLEANEDIDDPHRISVGTTLTIPGADASMPRYVVGPGDTLASIAGELHLPAQALLEANPDLEPGDLPPGQVLRLPPDWANDFDAGEGPVSMTGVITTVQCPAMRGPDGRLYALAGVVGQFQPGDRVEVQGQRAQATWCVPGAAIEIGEIRPSG